jgi:hypothetical protein
MVEKAPNTAVVRELQAALAVPSTSLRRPLTSTLNWIVRVISDIFVAHDLTIR